MKKNKLFSLLLGGALGAILITAMFIFTQYYHAMGSTYSIVLIISVLFLGISIVALNSRNSPKSSDKVLSTSKEDVDLNLGSKNVKMKFKLQD